MIAGRFCRCVETTLLIGATFVLSLASASPARAVDGVVIEVVTSVSDAVTGIVAAPEFHPYLFVLERQGRIRIIDSRTGEKATDAFLDITGKTSCCGERGLLGLAFHPDHVTNRLFFVYYTDNAGDTQVSSFSYLLSPSSFGGVVADEGSEVSVLRVDQPISRGANHNGGDIHFGPLDGLLYIALGDGGGGNDEHLNGQNAMTLLGSVLRIDVDDDGFPLDDAKYYAVPPGNPFVGNSAGADEIWVWGMRNPWRMSFDRGNGLPDDPNTCADESAGQGDLYMGDVGQGTWEEVSYQPWESAGGENYGWPCFEGRGTFGAKPPQVVCDTPPYVPPPIEFSQSSTGGCSVIGGFVYRGARHQTPLGGRYVFADHCAGSVWEVDVSDIDPDLGPDPPLPPSCPATPQPPDLSGRRALMCDNCSGLGNINTFGEDSRGELYIGTLTGVIYQVPEPNALTLRLMAIATLALSAARRGGRGRRE